MKVIVVLPTYNERPNIEAVVPAILANGRQWEVLVVDDNSPDGTGEVVDELARREGRVHVLHRSGKLGLGTAYRDGLSRALARLEPHTLTARGYAVVEELLYRCKRIGVTPAEYAISFVDRKAGESKISPGESFRALGILFKLRFAGWKPAGQRRMKGGVSHDHLQEKG